MADALAHRARRAAASPELKDFWLTLVIFILFAWMAEAWVGRP